MLNCLVQLVHKYWDCFYSAGVSRPILGIQFRVDTGSAQPSCCRQPGTVSMKVILWMITFKPCSTKIGLNAGTAVPGVL